MQLQLMVSLNYCKHHQMFDIKDDNIMLLNNQQPLTKKKVAIQCTIYIYVFFYSIFLLNLKKIFFTCGTQPLETDLVISSMEKITREATSSIGLIKLFAINCSATSLEFLTNFAHKPEKDAATTFFKSKKKILILIFFVHFEQFLVVEMCLKVVVNCMYYTPTDNYQPSNVNLFYIPQCLPKNDTIHVDHNNHSINI